MSEARARTAKSKMCVTISAIFSSRINPTFAKSKILTFSLSTATSFRASVTSEESEPEYFMLTYSSILAATPAIGLTLKPVFCSINSIAERSKGSAIAKTSCFEVLSAETGKTLNLWATSWGRSASASGEAGVVVKSIKGIL